MSSNYLYSPRVNETSSFACVRPLMTTLPPFATNYFSASAPIPDPSPVMTATLFSNLIVLSFCVLLESPATIPLAVFLGFLLFLQKTMINSIYLPLDRQC